MLLSRRQWAPLFVALLSSVLSSHARAAEEPPPDKALIVVRVPEGAALIIGKSDTLQTGTERTFLSPSLTKGKKYEYRLTANWSDSGKPRSKTRVVLVEAGTRTVVDLRSNAEEAEKQAGADDARIRKFLFTYSAVVTDLPAGKASRIWLPMPPSNEDQDVEIVAKDLPADGKIAREPKYGNRVMYLDAKAGADGTIPLKIVYRVKRKEVHGPEKEKPDSVSVAMYLKADKLVPIDGKPLELLKDKNLPKDQTDVAHFLYDIVNNHMKYSKVGEGWGRGDSVWACDSKYGNCTDFHSLFISLARAQKIPAKFEIGFPLPEKRGEGEIAGYHCWAFFSPKGQGWYPVDISEANKNPKMKDYYFGNLTEDRITFTTGRDITLVPKQDGEPLNFFVYPYVEVDAKTYPADKVKRTFSFEDVK
jgi:uncharacterized protein (TIGR03000 family)